MIRSEFTANVLLSTPRAAAWTTPSTCRRASVKRGLCDRLLSCVSADALVILCASGVIACGLFIIVSALRTK